MAMVTTYGITLFIAAGTAFLFAISLSYHLRMTASQGLADYIAYFLAGLNPPIVFTSLLEPGLNEMFANDLGIEFPLIWVYLIIYTILAICALMFSIRKLRPRMQPKR